MKLPTHAGPALCVNMLSMRRLCIAVLTAAAFAAMILAPSTAFAKTCSRSYVHATIGGFQKCLGRGEYCAHRYVSQYKRHGFNCIWRSGAYHLEPR